MTCRTSPDRELLELQTGRADQVCRLTSPKAARSHGQTLTNIVRRVAGRRQRVMSSGFLGEAKVGELEEGILPL